MHKEQSAFDTNFLNTIQEWFAKRNDIFVVVRYSHTAGGREYFWLQNFETFRKYLDQFPAMADVIVFRDDHFILRGFVDDEFIAQALKMMPENAEWMVADMIEPPDSNLYIWNTDTHAELLEAIEDLRGEFASVGPYTQWYGDDNESMISALIPLSDGTLKRGAY